MFTWCRQFKLSFCRCYLFAIRFNIYYKYTIYFALANRNALPEEIKKNQAGHYEVPVLITVLIR